MVLVKIAKIELKSHLFIRRCYLLVCCTFISAHIKLLEKGRCDSMLQKKIETLTKQLEMVNLRVSLILKR